MSSLAAARADNYYHHPDWDPSKESRNKYHGSHGALGSRARKLDQGILVIRFEMPFPVWCGGCSHLMAKGVRFNAEKRQIGAYHSTKVWAFSMRTPCCQTRLEIHTDPQNTEYVVAAGGRRKVTEGGAGEEGGRVEVDPRAEGRPTDPLAALEGAETDRARAAGAAQELAEAAAASRERFGPDVDNNRALRQAMRVARREEKARDARRVALGMPAHIPLAPETATDRLRASAVDYSGGGQRHRRAQQQDRRRIASGSIFSSGAVAAAGGAKRAGGALPSVRDKTRRIDPGTRLRLSAPDRK